MRSASPTSPKPFVFVLMPFDPAFDDIYTLGIKAVAKEVGAYAERVDEQQYAEGILERIFNQINKADVVVADMTGRNPNVFYEVGYAHALNKLVVLLTQSADDIPFDLQHRPHIVYGGRIDDLRRRLKTRLKWALAEHIRQPSVSEDCFTVSMASKNLAKAAPKVKPTVLEVWGNRVEGAGVGDIPIRFAIRNDSHRLSDRVTHIYMFGSTESPIYPVSSLNADQLPPGDFGRGRLSYPARTADSFDGLDEQFHIKGEIPSLPVGGMETAVLYFRFAVLEGSIAGDFRLRLLTVNAAHDFAFRMEVIDVKLQRVSTKPFG